MLKIEFDPDNTKLALAIGQALVSYAGGVVGTVVKLDASDAITQLKEAAHTQTDGESTGAPDDMGKSVETATDLDGSTATQTSADAGVNTGTDKPTHDEKGVMYIPAICAKAVKPFYASGPYKGQWKKGTKVDQAEYDRVYGEALAALGGGQQHVIRTQAELDAATSSAAEVFGGQQHQSDPINETVQEHPATPEEVFNLYTYMLQNDGAGVANAICAAAGIANGTLIFSRPNLAPRIFKELTTAKAQLVAGQGA